MSEKERLARASYNTQYTTAEKDNEGTPSSRRQKYLTSAANVQAHGDSMGTYLSKSLAEDSNGNFNEAD